MYFVGSWAKYCTGMLGILQPGNTVPIQFFNWLFVEINYIGKEIVN